MKSKAIVVTVLIIFGLSMLFVAGCGGSAPEEVLETPELAVSPADVASEIIKEQKAREETDSDSEDVEQQAAPKPTEILELKLSEEIFYIGDSVNLDRASFFKEIKFYGLYGGEWHVWTQSTLTLRKTNWGQVASSNIRLLVYLKPTSERDDNNYVTLDFDIHPPGTNGKQWSANIRRFESRSQGKVRFSLGHDIFIQDWQKAEISHLARQVLNSVFEYYQSAGNRNKP